MILIFDKRSLIPKLNVIAREHKSSTVKQQFSVVGNKKRAKTRNKKIKQDKASDVKFILPSIIQR